MCCIVQDFKSQKPSFQKQEGYLAEDWGTVHEGHGPEKNPIDTERETETETETERERERGKGQRDGQTERGRDRLRWEQRWGDRAWGWQGKGVMLQN